MILAIKLAFLRAVFWLWFVSRGYYTTSKIARFLFERKYRTQPLTEYANIHDLERVLGEMCWREDPLKGTIDIISSPHKVEWIYQQSKATGFAAKVGDCDEFAAYAATSIALMISRGATTITECFFLTVLWFDRAGKFHGHNVCAFHDVGGWGHIGNWAGGVAYRGRSSLLDVARGISGDGDPLRCGRLIAWAAGTPDLALVRMGFGA